MRPSTGKIAPSSRVIGRITRAAIQTMRGKSSAWVRGEYRYLSAVVWAPKAPKTCREATPSRATAACRTPKATAGEGSRSARRLTARLPRAMPTR